MGAPTTRLGRSQLKAGDRLPRLLAGSMRRGRFGAERAPHSRRWIAAPMTLGNIPMRLAARLGVRPDECRTGAGHLVRAAPFFTQAASRSGGASGALIA